MSELKTLNDIEDRFAKNGYNNYKGKPTDIIRAEAIKWIKAIHKIAMNNLDSPLPIHFEGMIFNKDTIFGARIILMKIYNITDEDLK